MAGDGKTASSAGRPACADPKLDEEIEDSTTHEVEQTEEEKISLTDKIKSILTRMFEVEDQKIS